MAMEIKKRFKRKLTQYKKILHPAAPYTHPEQRKDYTELCNPLILLVRQAGFEPATYGFVVRRSIRAELLAQKFAKIRPA